MAPQVQQATHGVVSLLSGNCDCASCGCYLQHPWDVFVVDCWPDAPLCRPCWFARMTSKNHALTACASKLIHGSCKLTTASGIEIDLGNATMVEAMTPEGLESMNRMLHGLHDYAAWHCGHVTRRMKRRRMPRHWRN